MARNEEKQLARLNRFYLQQQKEDELKKRPQRPRLDTLSTLDDVKKWIPSILRDIEFYVKQMEVSCYPKRTIEEFERRIGHLRGEYKAFVRKAHELEPDLSATPWSDRPYSAKRRKLNQGVERAILDRNSTTQRPEVTDCSVVDPKDPATDSFVPISTPLLLQQRGSGNPRYFYGPTQPEQPAVQHLDSRLQDLPLEFNFHKSGNAHVSALDGSGQDLPLEFSPSKSGKSATSRVSALDDSGQNLPLELSFKSSTKSGKSDVSAQASTLSEDPTSLPTTSTELEGSCLLGSEKEPNKICTASGVGSAEKTVSNVASEGANVHDASQVQRFLNLPYTDSSSDDET